MASKAEAKKTYKHFVPEAKKVPDWYKNFNFVLVTSMEQLNQIFLDSRWESGKSFIAFDTETTGLDFEELDLVGYSFCIDGKSAYYVPVNHYEYENNLGEPSVKFIYDRMCEAQKTFMYNARFDMRVFEYYGYKDLSEEDKKKRFNFVKYDMSKVNIYDVMNSVFNADTNIKLPSLKWSSSHFCGFEQMHFDEVIEGAGNFYFLNPSENPDTTFYAAADALCTLILVKATFKYYKESKLAGQLDNAVIYPLMHYEAEKLWLDLPKLQNMTENCEKEVNRLEKEVYDSFGYQINLNSPSQVAQALERLGIDTGERTSTGAMATGMGALERLPQETRDKFPALDSFLKYKEMNKLLTTYFKVYLKEAETKGYIRASYKLHQVPTGRLASGKDGKNTFFSPINIQALPKPHVTMYDVYDLGVQYRNYFSKKDNIIMGYAFVEATYDDKKNHIEPQDSRYIGLAEGMNPNFNIRSCITPKMYQDSKDDEWVHAAVDYAAQELRLAANISHEPVWENAFVEGRDVHKSTAEALWGKENYNKDYRKRAKGANFCECVGNLVLNSNRGYIKAELTKKGDSLVGFSSNTVVENVQILDNEPCIEFIFSNGVRASYHNMHKLRCWDGSNVVWVRAKDIDDSVQVICFRDKSVLAEYQEDLINLNSYVDNTRNLQKYGGYIDKNSPKVAYLMGLYVGDGHINIDSNGTADGLYQCVSIQSKDTVLDIIKEVGFEEDSIKCNIISNGNVAEIHYGGVGIARWVADNFGTPRNKMIPDWVFTDWSRESLISFLAGYIDSDGSKGDSGKCSIIYSSIPELLHKTALICNLLGLRTSFSSRESAIYRNGVKVTEGVNGKFKDCNSLSVYDLCKLDIKVLNEYKVWGEESKKWNMRWLDGSKENKYSNFINPVRESKNYKYGENKKLDNFIGNLRDGHTGPTEFNLLEVEKVTDECPLKSCWYPIKVYKKREFDGSIVAIECDTHEYISMGMNSHNSILYGAGASSFNDPSYDIHSMAEAEEFYNNYKKALPTLFQWEERRQRIGRRDGTVYTYFGRPRRVKGYFDNGNYSFANRTITNTMIQGTASDILKLVMIRLWKRLLNHPDYHDDVRFLVTIHDEIQFGIRASRLNEIVGMIEDCMTVILPEWRVPICTEASLGWSCGNVFAFERVYDSEDKKTWHYIPKLD